MEGQVGFSLLLLWLAAVATLAPTTLREKVTPAARPFPLTDVRLLDGPFRQAMQLEAQYLLSLDHDRLLHNFRVNAGLPSTATPLGGWEAPDVELRGHTVGHYLSALALMYASTDDARFKTRAGAMIAELAKVQDALGKKFHPGYLSAFPEEFFDRVEARQRVWAPYYTIHKIMAGLLDVNQLCGNAQALDVLEKKAAWVKFRVDRLTDEQQQAALETEYGGMNEVLANLYGVTGNADYLRLARQFDHKRLFDPLARGEDPLDNIHGNTQIPKMIGAAREYELTGETRARDIASFFWDRVAHHRSYAMGGNTDGERFFPISEFSKHLNAAGPETCNTYNMLKLTRHLFSWAPSADQMDFYERALLNHILPSQDPATGMVSYYCPLRPGAYRTYSTSDDSFWCCVGTGMENHAKYGDSIYFHDDRSLWVNLFIPSEVNWREKKIAVRQETRFPDEDTTRLTVKASAPTRLALHVRHPDWATAGLTVMVNGARQGIPGKRGSYVTVDREWRDGDRIEIRMPMSLHVETMPDDTKVLAILYGPIVLAGDLGKEGMESVRRYGPSAPQLGRVRTPVVPAFVGNVNEAAEILSKVKQVSQAPLRFRTDGLGQPHDVTLAPFHHIVDERYTVYWKLYSPAAWEARKAEAATIEARRKSIEQRTIDLVSPNDEESEPMHNYRQQGAADVFFEGRKLRETRGWMSYELRVQADRPIALAATFRGGEGRTRAFDIFVDGEKIATQRLDYHPTELFDFEYPIPETLTQGKQRVTVKLEAHRDAMAGPLVDLRTIARR